MKNGLIRGMLAVFWANILNMCLSLATNFLLPKYLQVDTYAAIKTFQLYIGYVGAMHLGFIDAMYLKYGGQKINALDEGEIGAQIFWLRLFQGVMTALMAAVGLLAHDRVLLFFALSVLPLNMTQYYQMFYQATGEFRRYGKIINITSMLLFAVNMALLFGVKTQDVKWYLTGYVALYIAVWLLLERGSAFGRSRARLGFMGGVRMLASMVRSGFFLMLGNFTFIFLTNVDRWFVKAMLDNRAFAHYSFAVSVVNMLDVLVTPISVTLYNHLCNIRNAGEIRRLRVYVMMFGALIVAAMFPAKMIVSAFLGEYAASGTVMTILFAAQMSVILTKSVYTNLYKAQKRQKKYFSNLVVVILIAVALDAAGGFYLGRMEAFSAATMAASVCWLILSARDFPEVAFLPRETVFLSAETAVFMLCGIFLNPLAGLLVYLIFSGIMILVLFRAEARELSGFLKMCFAGKEKRA